MYSQDIQKQYDHINQTIQIKSANDIDISKEIGMAFHLYCNELSDDEWERALHEREQRQELLQILFPDLSPFPVRAAEQMLPTLEYTVKYLFEQWNTYQIIKPSWWRELSILKEQYHYIGIKLLETVDYTTIPFQNFPRINIPDELVRTKDASQIIPVWYDVMLKNIELLKHSLQANDTCQIGFYCLQLWHNSFGIIFSDTQK